MWDAIGLFTMDMLTHRADWPGVVEEVKGWLILNAPLNEAAAAIAILEESNPRAVALAGANFVVEITHVE